MEEMTEYERKRLENVQRNQQMLAALCVQDTAQYLLSASKKPKSEPKGYKPPKREREPEPAVLRRSLRTSSLQSIGILGSHRPPAKLRNGLIALSPGSPIAPRSSKKKAPRSSKKRPLSLAETYVPHEEEVSYDRYLKRIIEISDHAPSADFMCAEPGWRSEGGGHVGPEFSPGDLKLETKDVARVTPNKIFSVHILPCRERVIVASGDKDGYLSLWDADWEEEEGDGVQIYEPHAAPVTGIATAAFSVQKVFSCSYDGFIRCMDIEKEVFHMLYTNKTDTILTAICCEPQGYQSVYFAEAAGRMKVLDLRVRGVSNSYDLHEKRINSIDINPHNPHLVSTSSNDCTASIWDVRKMRKRKSESIATVQHDREVHSAYFSPSGNYLATSSDDDNVGLWHGLDSWNTTMIYQYNPPRRWISSFSNDDNVGLLHGLDSWNTTMIDQYNPPRRWITSFRAIWGWDDQYLFIGNLNKALDAICITTKVTTTLHNSLMKATPTRVAKHPFSYGILAGATSGGQVYVWRKH